MSSHNCILVVLLSFITVISCTLQIVPGATWTAVNTGEHVQAHGAGIITVNGTYYMIGEDKSPGARVPNVNCYSSPNLVEWSFVGSLLTEQAFREHKVIERPKVIYNAPTRKYVLYMHADSGDYKQARVGVATSDTVCGKYTYRRSFRPLGHESRDMGLYQEPDGSAYLLSEDRSAGLRIYALSPDFLDVSRLMYTWSEKIEAPAVFKRGATYYMLGSHLSGWAANDNVYSTARSLAGPWSGWRNFAPAGSKTYQSQTAFVLPLGDGTAVYMGDRWVEKDLSRSTYVWLPLTVEGNGALSLRNQEAWEVPRLGTQGRDLEFTVKDSAKLSKTAKILANGAVGYVGGPENGTIVLQTKVPAARPARNTWRIYYRNGDKATRYASVQMGSRAPPQRVAFLGTEGQVGSSVLTSSSEFTGDVVISGWKSSWGPDIVKLKVVVER